MLEEVAPDGASSPQTRLLTVSTLIVGPTLWPDALAIIEKTANTTVGHLIRISLSCRGKRR